MNVLPQVHEQRSHAMCQGLLCFRGTETHRNHRKSRKITKIKMVVPIALVVVSMLLLLFDWPHLIHHISSPRTSRIPGNCCALARAVILDLCCKTFRFFAAGVELSSEKDAQMLIRAGTPSSVKPVTEEEQHHHQQLQQATEHGLTTKNSQRLANM